MTKPRRDRRETVGISPAYEGPEVLTELLRRAGSSVPAEEVAERFAQAQAQGADRSEVIPGLFDEEPRFQSPDSAKRLYANLFGLWARVEAGLGPWDDAPEVTPEAPAPPPLPPRGAFNGNELCPELVEAVWKHLAALPDREQQRMRDRFSNAQPDLSAWLEQVDLPEGGGLAAIDLAFETWAMFDTAFGERLAPVEWKDLKALEAEPPPVESEQPALADYVAEALDTLAEEAPELDASERAQVERLAATVSAALTRAVQPEGS